jgi:hypothetical protein
MVVGGGLGVERGLLGNGEFGEKRLAFSLSFISLLLFTLFILSIQFNSRGFIGMGNIC